MLFICCKFFFLLDFGNGFLYNETMEQNEIEQNKNEFLKIARDFIKRDGCDQLLGWLETTDFFTAPASSKFHLSEAGGLCKHSLNVFYRLEKLMKAEFGEKINMESIAIAALFHDICKTNYYKVELRNVKENGEWVQKPYFAVDDQLPYGHGEKSVYIVNGFMRLTREEAIAINWHMGGFDLRVQGGSCDYSNAYNKFPLAIMLHLADMQATFLDESKTE
jgi:hypothetical protein